MTTHLDRKALKRPDAFLERAGDLMTFVHDNIAVIAVAIGVLFCASVAYILYNNHAEHVAESADAALFDANKLLSDAVAKPKAAPGAPQAKSDKASAAADAPAVDWAVATKPAVESLEKVIHDFSGTRASFEANLTLADLYLKHGKFDEAIAHYQSAVDSARPRAARPAALYGLAYAYESAKRYDDAVVALRQIVAADSAIFKADALLAIGRNLALKGDNPKALEAYGQVSKDYPNTPMAKQAELAGARIR